MACFLCFRNGCGMVHSLYPRTKLIVVPRAFDMSRLTGTDYMIPLCQIIRIDDKPPGCPVVDEARLLIVAGGLDSYGAPPAGIGFAQLKR